MSETNNTINPVGAIKHDDARRASIPTTELAGEESMAAEDMSPEGRYQSFRHEFERGRDPELYWLNKYQNDVADTQQPDMRVDTRSLYRHEEIRPEMLISQLYEMREDSNARMQGSLFGNELPPTIYQDELERITNYYQHSDDWRNRLIQGDSLLVMNSLLQREGMAGKVQMVYIDPPYGIRFGSNWQMHLSKPKMAHESKDEQCSGEPEMIKAFRDTWELGIHSYLSYLRDRLILSRELLAPSGSCFVQISDENVHLVRNLMDEVFGSENFICQIIYQKTTGAGSPGELIAPPSVCDYILWYAKNKAEYKFRKLFVAKEFGGSGSSAYKKIELPDGRRLSISEWEKETGKKFSYSDRPMGSRLFALDNLTSQSGGDIGRFDIEFEGHTYKVPGGNVWKTNETGIERLKLQKRLGVSSKGGLGYIRYFDDFLAMPISCLWTDTVGQNQTGGEKIYVVQSALKPIQRCILMSTDPGDLVLDPTCGSGTTAFLAEQWGRRWITIDTSRIAINIAKRRLTTAVFPFYELFDKQFGNIRQGFIYKSIPHLKLSNIANGESAEEEILYDQPKEDKKKLRVSGPFTVETLQSFNVVDPDSLTHDEQSEAEAFQDRIFAHLKASGIRNGAKNEQALFYNIEAVANPYLNAKGYYKDGEGKERLAYFHIGPKFGTVSKRAVNEAIREFRAIYGAEGASWLVILGFSFEDNINDKDYNLGNFSVSKVRMHDDLMQDGLLKKDKNAGSFITIGEPDIALVSTEDGENVRVEIRGLDIYDPIKDIVKPRSVEDIAYWEMDDNYNGEQFVVRDIHFCGGNKKEFDAWRKGLLSAAPKQTKKRAQNTLRLELNEDLWEVLYDFRSRPIPRIPGRKVAVRVISQFGEESTKILTIE